MDASNTLLQARRARWAVAAIFLANGFIVGSWAPQIPLVLMRLAIDKGTLGLLILCFGIGALVSMPWCGWLMARFGQKRVLTFFGLTQPFGLACVVLSPDLPVTVPAMVILGALIGCCDVAMNAATVGVERRLGKPVMSSMHGFWSLGGFAGGALGGLMVEKAGALAHAGFVAVVAFAVAALAVRHLFETGEPAAPAAAGKAGGGRFSLPTSPLLYLLGLIAMFTFVAEGAVLDWGALYLHQERGADLAVAGLAYAFLAGAMAVMRFAGDRVRNRFGAVRTMRLSSLTAAAAMMAAAAAPTPLLAILAFGVCGLGVANAVPIAFSAAGNQPGVSSGAGMSVVTTMGYAGILLAPSSIGFIGEHVGLGPVFFAMALLLFLVFLMSGAVRAAEFEGAQPPARP